MFLTLHLKVHELSVTEAVGFTDTRAFNIQKQKTTFFQSVHNRLFSVVRVIVERINDNGVAEYHCVDFTGRSFLIVNKAPYEGNSRQIIKLVEQAALESRLTTYPRPQAYTIEHIEVQKDKTSADVIIGGRKHGSGQVIRGLTKPEYYFHEYVRTMVSEYFIGA